METIGRAVVGPIIGKVTDTTARILIEFNMQGNVTCRLTDPQGNGYQQTMIVPVARPVVFKFENLTPNTKYTVTFDYIQHISSSFTTTPSAIEPKTPGFNIAILSCDHIDYAVKKDAKSQLWNDMYDRIQRGEIQYCLHIGDNVYMDMEAKHEKELPPYNQVKLLLEKVPRELWHTKINDIIRIMKDRVYKTYGYEPKARVLANVPNIMMFDDHDIRDDWGFREEDSNPNTEKIDYLFGQCARQIIYEYQRQLWDDIDFTNLNTIDREFFYQIICGVGMFFLDYRGVRSWHNAVSGVSKGRHLGTQQWETMQRVFSQNGEFSNLKNVLFISTIPIVLFPRKISRMIFPAIDDVQEQWTYDHQEEQARMLDLLRQWKAEKEGREVTLIGGDIHFAGHTDIFYQNTKAFKQITTSGMNQKGPNKLEFAVIQGVLKGYSDLKNGYQYEHHHWTRKNNYAILRVWIPDGKTNKVSIKLIYANNREVPKVGMDIDNTTWHHEMHHKKCTIF